MGAPWVWQRCRSPCGDACTRECRGDSAGGELPAARIPLPAQGVPTECAMPAPAMCVVRRLVVTTAAVQVTPSVLRADGSVDSPSPLARELCALRLLPPHRNVTMLLAMGSERLSPALASHVGEALVEAGS